MQPRLSADADRLASRRSLSRYWARIGFTHRYEEHLVLDLAGEDLDAGLDALARDRAGADVRPRLIGRTAATYQEATDDRGTGLGNTIDAR